MHRARGQKGTFLHKSESDREVKSIRATDSVWKAFGDYAEEEGITRADLLEKLVHQWEKRRAQVHAVAESTETVPPAQPKAPKKAGKSHAKPASETATRYYLQLSYHNGTRKEEWYWDGSALIPKTYLPPKQQAKVYHGKKAALTAAKKLQRHVNQFGHKVRQPAELLSLKPVRVTW